MKTAKDQKINYLKYEKEHRKPAMSRVLTAACLLWMFITAAAEASSASQASLALQSAAAAGTAQTFTMNTFRYVVLFTIAATVPYNDLFYISEQGKTVPVLSKYRFAPVDIRKMRRAKTFLLLRGAALDTPVLLALVYGARRVCRGDPPGLPAARTVRGARLCHAPRPRRAHLPGPAPLLAAPPLPQRPPLQDGRRRGCVLPRRGASDLRSRGLARPLVSPSLGRPRPSLRVCAQLRV